MKPQMSLTTFIQKSDPTRFIVRCENIDREWIIHASIMQDEVTFEVTIYPKLYLTLFLLKIYLCLINSIFRLRKW